MRILRSLLIILVLLSFGLGQDNQDPRYGLAQEKEAAEDFKGALKIYEKIHRAEPNNNALIFKIAGMAYNLKQFKKSAKYYKKLAPNGNPVVLYNLACSLSQWGKEDEALDYLSLAVDKGFNQLGLMKTDPDLEAIRNLPRFTQILKKVKSIENIPEAQKFDFWVGHWNVFNLQNQQVGESHIEKILGNAVILENWYGGQGFQGKSFNHYHIESGKWVQYWVDQGSGRIHFEGNYDSEQDAIVYYEKDTEVLEKPARRLTFFNISADSVRQFSQLSADKGETWTVEYDFMYVRKPE